MKNSKYLNITILRPFFEVFVSYCGSHSYKAEKYKPYILKYKALILK